MTSTNLKSTKKLPPFIKVSNLDGHVERFFDTKTLSPGIDSLTGVISKDVTTIPGTQVYVRLYLPATVNNCKLPVVLYFHGGGFYLSTADTDHYHNYLNQLVSESRVIVVSVNYRRAPEYPVPVAYEDALDALKWVFRHADGSGSDPWLSYYADFGRFFLAGVSAGANIAHNVAMVARERDCGGEIVGVALVHPYFWGTDPTGSEYLNPDKRVVFDGMWPFVCPSSPDYDNPWINPVADGAPSLAGLGCRRVLVSVAGKDMLRERGLLYYKELGRSGWLGLGEIHEIEGVDHAFHIYNLNCEKAKDLVKRLSAFFNEV